MNINLSRPSRAAIDVPHGALIFGALTSSKPLNILEIGIGTGFITNLLLEGVAYNQMGHITSVDNFHDLGGNLPNKVFEDLKKKENISIIAPMHERDFVKSTEDDKFDFLVSDGDHDHAGEWVAEIFRIIKPNSFMFFHDVNNPGYPNLTNYKIEADKYKKPNFMFTKSSRTDEDCARGILMVINTK